MGKHDSKQHKLQVDIIENKNGALDFIEVRKKLRGLSSFNNDHPDDYVQNKDLEGALTPAEEIPFDWNVAPITEIDMTINGRGLFGNNPHIEVWISDLDINGTGPEYLYLPNYSVIKQKTGGQLTLIQLPDLNFDFTPTKTGYILLFI